MDGVAFAPDVFHQVLGVFTADELALRPLGHQRVGKRQATHNMASADLERGVGTDGEFHTFHQPQKSCLIRGYQHLP